MIKIIAAVGDHEECPLYQPGDAMEFFSPAVQGVGGVPVCSTAVGALIRLLPRLEAGADPASFGRVYCGGCTGRAWFRLAVETVPEPGQSPSTIGGVHRMSIFSGVSRLQLLQILPLMREWRIAPGDIVITKGDAPRALYAIAAGECEVVDGETVLATLHAGDCFGEVSLLTGEMATATIRAKVPGIVLELPKEHFPKAMAQIPTIAMALARILALRLKKTNTLVIEELKKGILGKLEMISPAELVQAMNVNSMTGMLMVQAEGKSLGIYFQDGQVYEVQAPEGTDEEAFYEFLTWARGTFRFEPQRKETTMRRLRGDTMGLLLEGMRRVDEYKKTGVWRKGE